MDDFIDCARLALTVTVWGALIIAIPIALLKFFVVAMALAGF